MIVRLKHAAVISQADQFCDTVTIKSIAEQVARMLGVPTVSLTLERASAHLGNPFLARFFSLDVPVSSEHTQALLGWAPEHETLLEDLETGDYFTLQASIRAEEIWLPHHSR
jgi:hypothetical protein